MSHFIRFMLNHQEVKTELPPGLTLLDYLRVQRRLTGTKIGCREGDCGACSVLVGEWVNGGLRYRAMTSCLMPLGNAAGRHIVTVEGLNREGLNVVQQAMAQSGATQCGFCTPGFVVALAGFCLSEQEATAEGVRASMDGNICRCTGYKSIERAGQRVLELLADRDPENPIKWLVDRGFLPDYFNAIPRRLQRLHERLHAVSEHREPLEKSNSQGHLHAPPPNPARPVIGGGTDLFVQRPEEMVHADPRLVAGKPDYNFIRTDGETCTIGGATTVADIRAAQVFRTHFPDLERQIELISSTPIRNMATVAGNFVNASPIGDLTIIFLALDSELHLVGPSQGHWLPLRRFYKGYKQLERMPDELLAEIRFALPRLDHGVYFNFEKVSKRTHLDIATVNSALRLRVEGDRIIAGELSAGGVAPIPLYLNETSAWLVDRPLNDATALEAAERARAECKPISDVRGSAAYKRLLLGQLVLAHFHRLFPEQVPLEVFA